MAVFNMAGYLIEERRRWPVIKDNIPNEFKIEKERHIQMRKPYQLPGWTKNSSYYSAPVGDQTKISYKKCIFFKTSRNVLPPSRSVDGGKKPGSLLGKPESQSIFYAGYINVLNWFNSMMNVVM